MISARELSLAGCLLAGMTYEANAVQFDYIANTNHFNTHIRFGAGGKLTAWQDCTPDGNRCPNKSTGTYELIGKCYRYHIDWNMGTYNYPMNNARDKDGNAC